MTPKPRETALPPPITLGQTVLWCSSTQTSNHNFCGDGEIFPAIITRILDSNLLNLTVFPDGARPFPVSGAFLDSSQTQPNSWTRLK